MLSPVMESTLRELIVWLAEGDLAGMRKKSEENKRACDQVWALKFRL